MATKANIQEYTTKMLDTALAECEISGDWTDSSQIISMAEIDEQTLVNTVVDEMDLNVRTDESLVMITKIITEIAASWKWRNYNRLEKLK